MNEKDVYFYIIWLLGFVSWGFIGVQIVSRIIKNSIKQELQNEK